MVNENLQNIVQKLMYKMCMYQVSWKYLDIYFIQLDADFMKGYMFYRATFGKGTSCAYLNANKNLTDIF